MPDKLNHRVNFVPLRFPNSQLTGQGGAVMSAELQQTSHSELLSQFTTADVIRVRLVVVQNHFIHTWENNVRFGFSWTSNSQLFNVSAVCNRVLPAAEHQLRKRLFWIRSKNEEVDCKHFEIKVLRNDAWGEAKLSATKVKIWDKLTLGAMPPGRVTRHTPFLCRSPNNIQTSLRRMPIGCFLWRQTQRRVRLAWCISWRSLSPTYGIVWKIQTQIIRFLTNKNCDPTSRHDR